MNRENFRNEIGFMCFNEIVEVRFVRKNLSFLQNKICHIKSGF